VEPGSSALQAVTIDLRPVTGRGVIDGNDVLPLHHRQHRGSPRDRTSLPGFGDQAGPRPQPIRRTKLQLGGYGDALRARLPSPASWLVDNPNAPARRILRGQMDEQGLRYRTALPALETGAFPEGVERQVGADK